MRILRTLALLTMGSLAATAAPILNLSPSSGPLFVPIGGDNGWGFSITPDAVNWTVFIGSFPLFETNAPLGSFVDLIGPQGGPQNGALAPGITPWTQSYDLVGGTGLGAYFVSPFATLGDTNSGTLFVLYESYSGDPSSCSNCLVGSGELTVPFEVSASAPIPEPGYLGPVAVFLGAGLALRRRRGAA